MQLLPLILRCLALPTAPERLNVISTLESILETPDLSSEADKLLHTRAEAIIEGLLVSIHAPRGAASGEQGAESSGALRSAALRCIAALPGIIRIEVLGKHKARVLRELGEALDDPVREVRREAVECRAAWYAYK
jgi:DNA repair/transcription protein MET18/MMS19